MTFCPCSPSFSPPSTLHRCPAAKVALGPPLENSDPLPNRSPPKNLLVMIIAGAQEENNLERNRDGVWGPMLLSCLALGSGALGSGHPAGNRWLCLKVSVGPVSLSLCVWEPGSSDMTSCFWLSQALYPICKPDTVPLRDSGPRTEPKKERSRSPMY